MATSTESNQGAAFLESAFERATEASEQWFAATRKVGNQYLDSYEKAVDQAIELELKFVGATRQEWLQNLIEVQAEFARELTNSYTSTARTLLK
jgi:hypothetical protein